MIIFPLISLVALIISLSLASFVYSIKPRTKSNIFFISSCLLAAFLSLVEFEYRSVDSYQTASYWINLSIIWPVLIAFIVHFVLLFTEQRTLLKNPVSYVFIYLPALIFLVLDSATNIISYGITHKYWGWTYIINPGPVWILSSIWTVIMISAACYLCWSYFFKQRDSVKRKQALLIAIGISIPLIFSTVTEIIFNIMHIEAPDITTSVIVAGCIFIGIGIFRYGLFQIDPLVIAESILKKIPDLILVTDKDEIIIKVNSAVSVMLGYKEEEIKGQKLELITMENNTGGHKLLIDEKGKISDYETTFYTKSGDKIEVSVSVALLKSKQKNNIGLVIVARDITEKKRTEEELVKLYEQEKTLTQNLQDEMKRRVEFTRALVHELKTPLTPIIASSDLLVTVIQEPAHLRLAKNVHRGAAELNSRIDELLDAAKGEIGILQLDNGQVDM
ncbi:MAG: PAS domain S-box protein, partial [Chloroflexi bacterium]|nr:PAS domain S-box protein [Chloroflexota bacterium]